MGLDRFKVGGLEAPSEAAGFSPLRAWRAVNAGVLLIAHTDSDRGAGSRPSLSPFPLRSCLAG